jgi:hypothetical protein
VNSKRDFLKIKREVARIFWESFVRFSSNLKITLWFEIVESIRRILIPVDGIKYATSGRERNGDKIACSMHAQGREIFRTHLFYVPVIGIYLSSVLPGTCHL